MPDLVIRGGKVARPDGVVEADIAIEGEVIAEIRLGIEGGAHEIDATGLFALPGVIDIHVHFNEPGREDWEDAHTGSRALAAGGGTLYFDMPLNSSPCTLGPTEFQAKRDALEAASITDFGLWGGIVPGNLSALAEMAALGAVGFKAFLCDSGLPEFPRASDVTLYEAMREAARLDLPVAVHAESQEITSELAARMATAGRTDIRAFLDSRPVWAEVEAIQRAGLLARETGCKLHIVHVSSGRGVAAALEMRERGADLSIETCPHYLYFDEGDLERIGALAKCAPPLRARPESDSLWSMLLNEQVDVVASDHSPCPPERKNRDNFFEVWGGIAGVQSMLPVLLDAGNNGHSLQLERIVALTARNPARRFRIPNKGSLEPGFDADLTLVELDAFRELTAGDLRQRHPVSPYLGHKLHGAIRYTVRRGEPIWFDEKIQNETRGKFVRPLSERKTNSASGTHS